MGTFDRYDTICAMEAESDYGVWYVPCNAMEATKLYTQADGYDIIKVYIVEGFKPCYSLMTGTRLKRIAD